MNPKYEFFLSDEVKSEGFAYSKEYLDFVSGDVPDLTPWHFFYSRLDHRFKGLQDRYPSKGLVPFARRQDNDDVACFDSMACDGRVLIIHDFASPGWEERLSLKSFDEWLDLAKSESAEWDE